MKKFKALLSILMVGTILLTACGNNAGNVDDTVISASELPADISLDGSIGDTDLESWVVETTGITTYTPIMPDEAYTMSASIDEIDDPTDSVESSTETAQEVTTGTTVGKSTDVSSTETSTAQTQLTTVTATEEDIADAILTVPSLEDRLSTTNTAHAWYYSKLTASERAVYDAIVHAACNFSASVTFDAALTREEYARLLGLVYLQNPELFWLRGSIDLAEDGKSAKLYYQCTQEQAESLETFLMRQVGIVLTQIPPEADDLKKVQVFHDYICHTNTFMKGGTTTSTVIGSLVDGVSQCLGYAKGMQYLCNIANIPCLTITGANDGGASHAWNVVQMSGEWYNVDCTWDDPVLKVYDAGNASYMYLGVRDIDIANITHFDINKAYGEEFIYFEPPVCNSTAQNGDYVYGYYAASYEEGYELLRKQMLEAVRTGSTVIHVKFAEQSTYLNAVERLKDNKELLNLKNEVNSTAGVERIIKKVGVNKTNSLNYFEVVITY